MIGPTTQTRMVGYIDVDSRKAWLIAFAAHICVAIHAGTTKALGVMIPEITRDYQTTDWVVGLIIALMSSIGGIAGEMETSSNYLTFFKKFQSFIIIKTLFDPDAQYVYRCHSIP